MVDDKIKLERTLIGVMVGMAKSGPEMLYEVALSTGTTIKGQLSPLDEQSDHIRVNPAHYPGNAGKSVLTGDPGVFVALAHIVSVRLIMPSRQS